DFSANTLVIGSKWNSLDVIVKIEVNLTSKVKN
ncbi:hypothetical protein LINPERHAP1_LOCUS19048, partial [Linum perenne]